MLELSVKGSLGKFSHLNLPDKIIDKLLNIGAIQAYKTAKAKAPYLPEHPIHLRDTIKRLDFLAARYIKISTDSPYAFITEFGSFLRKAVPFMRLAKAAAQRKMKSTMRSAILEAAKEEKQ
ncbi:hypothetical protein M0R72_15920 [Candidatus Pacearchaeota archaeon]|jgi:hypothetical protein|nr:hypothetical protein [Candidatus Pacearchaeota archaeon]